MKEVKVNKAIVNESKQLVVSFVCKEGDYTGTELELLRQAKINGDLLDLEFTWLISWDKEEELREKRQQLGLSMKDYATKFWLKEQDVIDALYKKYKVKSRVNLTYEQLEESLESYRVAIMTNNP